jgi:hypothetical protein
LPSVNWTQEDLSAFDSVVVGVSPLTSLSANYAYGGLHAINELKDSGKLTLLVDAPQVSQIGSGLRSIRSNPESLTKTFYRNRPGFQQASNLEVSTGLLGAVEWLLEEQWPTTLYPGLPWKSSNDLVDLLPIGAKNSLIEVNRDFDLIKELPNEEKRDRWAVDNFMTPWAKSVVQTVAFSTSPMKWHKGWDDSMVQNQISRSIGVMITPYRQDGTWWSYRYAQALSSNTPIATGWQESSRLHESWSFLAATIESMSQNIRDKVSAEQRESYLAALPKKSEADQALQDALKITKRKAIV